MLNYLSRRVSPCPPELLILSPYDGSLASSRETRPDVVGSDVEQIASLQ
jgi:hypothetical protein